MGRLKLVTVSTSSSQSEWTEIAFGKPVGL